MKCDDNWWMKCAWALHLQDLLCCAASAFSAQCQLEILCLDALMSHAFSPFDTVD